MYNGGFYGDFFVFVEINVGGNEFGWGGGCLFGGGEFGSSVGGGVIDFG